MKTAKEVLSDGKIIYAKLKLMEEIGSFAYIELTEEEVLERIKPYVEEIENLVK